MRRKWYADNHDLVKWTAVLRLAKEHNIPSVIYAGYAPADDLCAPKILPLVWDHFRNLSGYQHLVEAAGLTFKGVDASFDHVGQREAYRLQVVQAIRNVPTPRLLLLDPDTGIAPQQPKREHVTHQDITTFWEELTAGDWLCLYQHARRLRTWSTDVELELQQLLHPAVMRREIFSINSNVALFCLLRP